MIKTRRIAVIAAVLAGTFMVPAVASAADLTFRAPQPQTKFVVANQSGRAYSAWANNEINEAVNRINARGAALRMSASDRALLHNNTMQSAQILRNRVAQVSVDGTVTAADRQNVRNLALALQAELRKAHGNIDSFWLL